MDRQGYRNSRLAATLRESVEPRRFYFLQRARFSENPGLAKKGPDDDLLQRATVRAANSRRQPADPRSETADR